MLVNFLLASPGHAGHPWIFSRVFHTGKLVEIDLNGVAPENLDKNFPSPDKKTKIYLFRDLVSRLAEVADRTRLTFTDGPEA